MNHVRCAYLLAERGEADESRSFIAAARVSIRSIRRPLGGADRSDAERGEILALALDLLEASLSSDRSELAAEVAAFLSRQEGLPTPRISAQARFLLDHAWARYDEARRGPLAAAGPETLEALASARQLARETLLQARPSSGMKGSLKPLPRRG